MSADQVERLNWQVKDRVARVELASNAGAPVALELRQIEFAPEFLRGTRRTDRALLRWARSPR